MKNLSFVLFIALLGVFGSCDKCKDVDCLNGATCNKGDCECTTFFTGEKCGTEVRASYNGKYAGTLTYSDGSRDLDTLDLRSMGTDPTKLEIVEADGLVITLTNSKAFKINAEETDGNDRYITEGTGNFTSTAMSFSAVGKFYENGVLKETETIKFDGTKL